MQLKIDGRHRVNQPCGQRGCEGCRNTEIATWVGGAGVHRRLVGWHGHRCLHKWWYHECRQLMQVNLERHVPRKQQNSSGRSFWRSYDLTCTSKERGWRVFYSENYANWFGIHQGDIQGKPGGTRYRFDETTMAISSSTLQSRFLMWCALLQSVL